MGVGDGVRVRVRVVVVLDQPLAMLGKRVQPRRS